MLTSTAWEVQEDMEAPRQQEDELTIVFTDIEGSTAINERLGDETWLRVLLEHNALLRDRIWRHGGREAGRRGDGFLVVFPRPVDAARFAISVQRLLSDRAERHPHLELRIRVGIHHGRVLSDGDAVLGANVCFASRVTQAARGGEILFSSTSRELLATENVQFDDPRDLPGAGPGDDARVFPLRWARS